MQSCVAVLTCSLDKPGVGAVWNDRDRKLPEVHLQRSCDDIDVFIGLRRDVCLLTICENVTMKSVKSCFFYTEKANISTFPPQNEVRNKEIFWAQVKKTVYSCSVFCQAAAIIRLSSFPLTLCELRMRFRAGRGLLVQADWTSQCCEPEWHSVMDDLPHADLAQSLAHCCRLLLTVKIHTALGQDRLILIKSRCWIPTLSQGGYSTAKTETACMYCIPKGPYVHTEREWQDVRRQMDANPSLKCHLLINVKSLDSYVSI